MQYQYQQYERVHCSTLSKLAVVVFTSMHARTMAIAVSTMHIVWSIIQQYIVHRTPPCPILRNDSLVYSRENHTVVPVGRYSSVCIYVCMYVCMYVWLYVRMYIAVLFGNMPAHNNQKQSQYEEGRQVGFNSTIQYLLPTRTLYITSAVAVA